VLDLFNIILKITSVRILPTHLASLASIYYCILLIKLTSHLSSSVSDLASQESMSDSSYFVVITNKKHFPFWCSNIYQMLQNTASLHKLLNTCSVVDNRIVTTKFTKPPQSRIKRWCIVDYSSQHITPNNYPVAPPSE